MSLDPRFRYVQMDAQAVVRDCIKAEWRERQQHIPSLPDIDTFIRQGISDEQVYETSGLLDEVDKHLTRPMRESRTWDDGASPMAYLQVALAGIVPPETIEHDARDPETPYTDALYAWPHDDPRHDAFTQALPHVVRSAQLTRLYQLACDPQPRWPNPFAPGWLGYWWATLHPALVTAYWRATLPRDLADRTLSLKTRADLLRGWRYNPLSFISFVVSLHDELERLPHARLPQSLKPAISQADANDARTTYEATRNASREQSLWQEVMPDQQ
jgi:hypothetical protein